jgi:hypothetical protein
LTAAILCPDMKEHVEVTWRVEDIAENMEQPLKDMVKDFTYFSLALDESSDAHRRSRYSYEA